MLQLDYDQITQSKLKDNSKRVQIAITFFWIFCLANVVAIISGYMELDLLTRVSEGQQVTEDEATFNDLRQAIIGFLQTGLYIATIIVFLNWFRRSYGNLHRIGVKDLKHQETMAIWSFVIPIISLFRPYQIAKEITVKSQDKIKEMSPSYMIDHGAGILGIWWTLFIIKNFIANFAFRTILKDDTLEQLILSSKAYLASDAIDILAAIATIFMIKHIAKLETSLTDAYRNYKTEKKEERVPVAV